MQCGVANSIPSLRLCLEAFFMYMATVGVDVTEGGRWAGNCGWGEYEFSCHFGQYLLTLLPLPYPPPVILLKKTMVYSFFSSAIPSRDVQVDRLPGELVRAFRACQGKLEDQAKRAWATSIVAQPVIFISCR